MSDPAEHGRAIVPQLVIGLLIIVAGILFMLENVGVLDAQEYLRYWPAGLIAVGLVKLWQGRGGAVGGFIFVLAGGWLLLQSLDIVRISLWNLWPLLLVFAGASMVWRGMYGARRGLANRGTPPTNNAVGGGGGGGSGGKTQKSPGGGLSPGGRA